jgi:hypothetical protein
VSRDLEALKRVSRGWLSDMPSLVIRIEFGDEINVHFYICKMVLCGRVRTVV